MNRNQFLAMLRDRDQEAIYRSFKRQSRKLRGYSDLEVPEVTKGQAEPEKDACLSHESLCETAPCASEHPCHSKG